ncbi:MAG: hypothetical protein LBL93_00615, partial [Ruminococcus sp.]|nr:hypothetical protein [Ruminococcus sp.]
NIPLGNNPQIDIKIADLETLKINDEVSALNFKTTKNYKGVNFDYGNEGMTSGFFPKDSDHNYFLGASVMVKSNTVDFVFNVLRCQTVEEIKSYDELLSINDALKTVSKNLSDTVKFDLNKIELVYCEYHINDSMYEGTAKPAWKIKLYNPNDGLTYITFIDAENGGNFRYYTTENKAFRQN